MREFWEFLKRVFTRLLPRIPWKLHIVVLDGADQDTKATIPLKEAIPFIEKFSRFRIDYTIEAFPFTEELRSRPFMYHDNQGQEVWNVLEHQIPEVIRQKMPVAHFYLFLFKLDDGLLPALSGSTFGIANGILKGDKRRPYATICWNQWAYNNQPSGGFLSRAASIWAHELINCIDCITAVTYGCTPMNGPHIENSPDPYIMESNRLAVMGNACYTTIGSTNPL
jgi:hypothetical protein